MSKNDFIGEVTLSSRSLNLPQVTHACHEQWAENDDVTTTGRSMAYAARADGKGKRD
ncbi:hypothetical protein OSTOST_18452 [Ostertagia ostertagi]